MRPLAAIDGQRVGAKQTIQWDERKQHPPPPQPLLCEKRELPAAGVGLRTAQSHLSRVARWAARVAGK